MRCWVVWIVCMGCAAAGASDSWIERSDAIALEILSRQAAFQPEGAAGVGLAGFDEAIVDLGPNRFERLQALDEDVVATLDAALADAEDPRLVQDLKILKQATQDQAAARAVARAHLIPYFDLPRTLFQSVRTLLDPRIDASRRASVITRLNRYAGLEEGYQPLVELAQARTRERLDVDGLVGPYIGELENSFASAPRYLAGMEQMLGESQLSGWQAPLEALKQQLAAYREWLDEHLVPRARAESQLPPAVYRSNLRSRGVNATPEELIREGQIAYQFIRTEMKALARAIAADRGWKDGSLLAVMRALKAEQIPEDEVLATYQARLEEIEVIIRREDIITLPERDAVIRMATDAEAAAVPAPFMSPPQLINNTGQYGEFVLVRSNPTLGAEAQMDDWSHNAITWGLTVHEARPGHELQFASLVENGTSLARALFAFNSANVEGWGLYSEAIMHEYLPLDGQLFSLWMRLMRAARMFLDPMVNTGQITRDEAERFLIEQCGLSKPMASSEADRYAFWLPGQATAYYYGYQHLLQLRTDAELRLGERFDQKAFHDFIIEQGLLPPEMLREAVEAEFYR